MAAGWNFVVECWVGGNDLVCFDLNQLRKLKTLADSLDEQRFLAIVEPRFLCP